MSEKAKQIAQPVSQVEKMVRTKQNGGKQLCFMDG